MSRIILSLSLLILLSTSVFGQSYEGFYRARFISLDRGVNPSAEFEIQSNGAVMGKIIVGESITIIRGEVDASGNLKAESITKSGASYLLKADMKLGQRITLTSRSETVTAGNRANSQAIMQGNYSRIETPAAQFPPSSTSGKSELMVEQPSPLFEKEFSSGEAKVIVEKNASLNVYHLQMMGGAENTERGFYFSIARPQDSPQKIWKAENIRALNYVEKTENLTKINRFRTTYEMWLRNRDIVSGQIELVSENSRQMVFRITNLKIKNEANHDTAIINGIVYAKISK